MRRTLTLLLVVLTLVFWGASLWTLSGRLSGTSLLTAAIPSCVGLLIMAGLAMSGRIFNPNDSVRKLFSAMLACSLLFVFALVYVDLFFLSGEILRRGLEFWRLDIYFDARFSLTLAFGGAVVHPILFVILSIAMLCLPPPKNGFSMRD